MTKTILHIDSSARQENSISRELSAKTVQALKGDEVIYRDLAKGLPFLNEDWLSGRSTPKDEQNEAQAKATSPSFELIEELRKADEIVIGTPMYNFTIPATLKLWIDHIALPRETFYYDNGKPVGMLTGKKAHIVMATDGVGIGSPYDFGSEYIKFALGFVGIEDINFIQADRILARPEVIAESEAEIAKLAS